MVKKVIVKKILSDEETEKMKGVVLPKGYFKKVFKEDVDVYTEDGKPLLRFRKGVLSQKNVDKAYDNMIKHARKYTSQRGTTAGKQKGKNFTIKSNKPIRSNIIGYFDGITIMQKYMVKKNNLKTPKCRQTGFTANEPEKWKKIVPLVQDIAEQYKKLFPEYYKYQFKQADKTVYRIPGTPFSTVTTNLNLQTAAHTDRGNLARSMGNLVVIEKGKYKGGYTGFPQYGEAVDVRSGDFLGMDIHQVHGNTPIESKDENHERLSLVSYLREKIVEKCQDDKKILPGDYFKDKKNKDKVKKKAASAKKKAAKKTKKKTPKSKSKRKTAKKKSKILGIF